MAMSKLEELIAELCPDGVELKSLSQVLTIKNGKDYKGFDKGDIPVYGTGGIMTFIDRAAFEKPSVLIPRKGSIDKLYYVDVPFWTVDTIFYTDINTDIIEPKFVFYYLQAQHLERLNTAGGVPSLTQAVLNSVKIPLPPLPVQREIVRILDNFTELTAELTAELSARKKQYEYYREKLLSFGDNVHYKKLGDLAKIGDGLHGTPEYKQDGEYYFINGNNLNNRKIEFYANTKKVDNDSYIKHGIEFSSKATIFMSINGTIGNVSVYDNERIVLGKSVAYFNIIADGLSNRFLFYLLQTNFSKIYYESKLTGSTIKNLGLKSLREYIIPVPPLEVQARIVAILDRFDALCNDLSSGLPAEIAARRQQYEYYRDQLLSFLVRADGETEVGA